MKLSNRNRFLMGLTLFSMFFGAGNLIFPPFLAYQAGNLTWPAMIGFCISAIGFPMLGVIAISKVGGIETLSNRVSPWFSRIFVLLTYFSIGPGLAIPRNSVTSFEMSILPFLGEGANIKLLQFIFSLVFFAIATIVALRPEKLSDRLGKILTPILLTLIVIIFFTCVFRTGNHYGSQNGAYSSGSLVKGFLGGYQTMDAIAALNFGIIFALNIKAKGVTDEKSVVKETFFSTWIAGLLLLLVYSALAHIGGVAGSTVEGAKNGAQTLTGMVGTLFGPVGTVILAVVFVIACLNTCIGLLSCCSNYFNKLFPKIHYKVWVVLFALGSMIVANAGLNAILSLSVPVLEAIYPVCILLIVLALFDRFLKNHPLVYPISVGITTVISLLTQIAKIKVMPEFFKTAMNALPFAESGLSWVLPAIIGIIIGLCFPPKNKDGRNLKGKKQAEA